MRTLSSNEPTEFAKGFSVAPLKNRFVVRWLDHVGGEDVVCETPHGKNKREEANLLKRKLEQKAAKAGPQVYWVPTKNSYWVKFYAEVDGKRKQIRTSLSTKDPDIAALNVPRKIAELGFAGEARTQVTFGVIVKDFLDQRRDRPQTTVLTYFHLARHFLQFFTENKPVASFTSDDFFAFIADCERRCAGSVQNRYSMLKSIFKQAQKRGLIANLPDMPDGPKAKERSYWLASREQITKMIEVAENLEDGSKNTGKLSDLELYLWLASYTGGRLSFYRDLKWERVDFDLRQINFLPIGQVQTTKKRPVAPMAEQLAKVLERAYAERTSDHVLNTTPAWLMKKLRRALKESADPELRAISSKVHSHAFRRAFITWALVNGHPAWLIAKIVGNSPQQIFETYAQYESDQGLTVVNSIQL